MVCLLPKSICLKNLFFASKSLGKGCWNQVHTEKSSSPTRKDETSSIPVTSMGKVY